MSTALSDGSWSDEGEGQEGGKTGRWMEDKWNGGRNEDRRAGGREGGRDGEWKTANQKGHRGKERKRENQETEIESIR